MGYLQNNYYKTDRASYDYYDMVNHGVLSGHSQSTKFGFNSDIDNNVAETIWPVGGVFNPLNVTGAERISFVSDDANDISDGTGARGIAIFGLDEDYNEISELFIATNGTTPVLSTLSYRSINRVAVALSGSSQYNEGNITLTQQTSGLTLAYIPAEESITQQCIYTVPAGKTAYLKNIFLNAVKPSGGSAPLVEFKVYSWNRLSQTRYDVIDIFQDAGTSNNVYIPSIYANNTDSGNTLTIEATSDTNNSRVFGRFQVSLIDNL